MMLKLPLKPSRYKREDYAFPWASCTPFVDNKLAQLIHRPMRVSTYKIHTTPHISISNWCGNTFSGDNKFTFMDTLPMNGKLLCARCEANAVAAGLLSADEIAGHHVHQGKLIVVKTCCKGE